MYIEIKNILKSYNGKTVLDIDYFSASPSKITALIGPNGAGKTTLFKITGMIEKADSGQLYYDNQEISKMTYSEKLGARRRLGFIAQSPGIFSGSVEYNIQLPLILRKINDFNKAAEAAKATGIEHLLKKNARELSGGEKQRLSVARAIVSDPDIFFFDEPTANLDPLSVKIIEDMIVSLKKNGKTVLLSTHNLIQAREFADDVFFIQSGKIIQSGSADEVFSKPVSGFIAEFTGTQNVLEGEIFPDLTFRKDGLIIYAVPDEKILLKLQQAQKSLPVIVTIRPEEILISEKPFDSSARNCLKSVIKKIKSAGRVVEIIIETGGVSLIALVTRQSAELLGLKPGKEVYAVFKATSVNTIS
ncbi:MAG: ABC transporter ATP-binding protein [Elusimicrobiota bacterium]